MGMILSAFGAIFGLVNLAAFVIVLVQLFKAKGTGHGIAGLCCGLYTFVWGWQNADKLDASTPPVMLKYKQWMLVWTGSIVVSVVLNLLARAMA